MKTIFQSALARSVMLTDDNGTRSVRAFFAPVRITAPETPQITAAGTVDGRRWRVILPPLALDGTVTLTDGDTVYLLLRRETIGNGDHIEALACRQEGTVC